MTINIGSVAVDVVPSAKAFNPTLRSQIIPGAEAIGDDIGKIIAERVAAAIGDGIEKGLGEGTRQSLPKSKEQGDRVGRQFGDAVKARITAALKTLPDIKLDADASPVDEALARIRTELAELSSKRIGVDVDEDEALTRLEALRGELDRIARESPSVSVRVNATEAAGQLAAIKAQIDRTDATIRAKVEVDPGTLRSSLAEVEQATTSSGRRAGGLMAAGIGAGLLLGGPVLAAAGTTVVGVGVAAIVGYVEKSNPVVAAAWAQLGDTTKTTLQQSLGGVTPVIVGVVGQWEQGIQRAGPIFGQLARESVPFVTELSDSLLHSGETVLPEFTSAMARSEPVTHALSTGIGQLTGGVVTFIREADFNQAGTGLQALLGDLGQLIAVGGRVIGVVMPLGNAILTSVVPAALTLAQDIGSDLSPALQVVTAIVSALSPVLQALTGPLAAVAAGAAGVLVLRAAFNAVTGAVSASKAAYASLESNVNRVTGLFGVLSVSGQKAAVAQADAAVSAAAMRQQSAATAVAIAEEKLAAGGSAASMVRLAASKEALAVADAEATAAEGALAAAGEASTFAFGPLGIILGVVGAGLLALVGSESAASASTGQLTVKLQDLEGAAAGGASGLARLYAQHSDASRDIDAFRKLGVSLKDLTDASNGSVPAAQRVADAALRMRDAQQKAVDVAKAHRDAVVRDDEGVRASSNGVHNLADAVAQANGDVQTAQDKLNGYNSILGDANGQLKANQDAQGAAGQATGSTASATQAAAGAARLYGIAVEQASKSLADFISKNSDSGFGVASLTQQWQEGQAALAAASTTAASSITDHFKQADQQVSQAAASLSSANYSYRQSIQGVADAQYQLRQAQQGVADADHQLQQAEQGVADAVHSRGQAQQQVASAQQGIRDAELGVASAERNLAQAQQSERDAQVALTQARKQAEEQLISLRLQLQDQVASEEQARLGLFDAQADAAKLGITLANARQIIGQPITTDNESQIKSALSLVQAQNQLNDSLNTGKNLRSQVNQANAAGVNGEQGVVSAQRSLIQAQQQVASSAQAILQAQRQVTAAHQQLTNANYALHQADLAVANAEYNVGNAHRAVEAAAHNVETATRGVANAQHQQAEAARQVATATRALKDAQDADSRSLDINTAAGARNFQLLDSYSKALIAQHVPDQERYKKIIDLTSRAFGLSGDAAIAADKKLGLLPQDYRSAAQAAQDYANAIKAINDVLNREATLERKRFDFQASHPLNTAAGARYFGGPTAAEGIVLPGYSPGVDSVHALLSPGEAVLVPELVRQIGPSTIMAANARAAAHRRYSLGGIVGMATGGVAGSKAASAKATTAVGGDGAAAPTGPNAADMTAQTAAAGALDAVLKTLAATVTGQVTPAEVGLHAALVGQVTPAVLAVHNSIGTQFVPTLHNLQAVTSQTRSNADVQWAAITNRVVSSDNTIGARQAQLQGQMQSSWSIIHSVTANSVAGQVSALNTLGAGLARARDAIGQTANWTRVEFGAMVGYAQNPVRQVIRTAIDQGIIAAWNSLDSQFQIHHHVAPVPIPFSTGGPVPGTGTADDVPALLTPGEYVLPVDVVDRWGLNNIRAAHHAALTGSFPGMEGLLNGDMDKAIPVQRFAAGGLVVGTASEANEAIARGLAVAKSYAGKPYIWGGTGPAGVDCSGMVSVVTNALRGEANIYHRLGVAASQPWPGFVPGLSSAWATGFNGHHTAATLSGTNVESSVSPIVFPGKHGADDGQFSGHASLPIVGGKFVSGGGGGFDPNALVDQAFSKVAGMITAVRQQFPGNVAAIDATAMADSGLAGVKKFSVDKLSEILASSGDVPGSGVQRWSQLVLQALAMVGQPASLLQTVLRRMQQESGGNPRIVNHWDVNAKRGTPSGGLMQLIQPTFDSNWDPRTPHDLFNPLSNILASFHYAIGRYGSLSAAYNRPGGYDLGGVANGIGFMEKNTLAPERVLSPRQTIAFEKLVDAITRGGQPTQQPRLSELHVHAAPGHSEQYLLAEAKRQFAAEMSGA